MSAADVKHPLSTRALAWSFAIGGFVLVAGLAVGLVGFVVAVVKEARR